MGYDILGDDADIRQLVSRAISGFCMQIGSDATRVEPAKTLSKKRPDDASKHIAGSRLGKSS